MKTLSETLHTALPKFSLFYEVIKHPSYALFTLTPTVPAVMIVDVWNAFYILCWMFLGDLITGILASYYEWRKSDKKDKWFFGKGEGFSSDKFKKMFIKIIVYCGSPLVLYHFQQTFLIKNVTYSKITDAEIDIATIMILLFILNEGYSIFHENLPRCGFNLWDRIKKIAVAIKKAIGLFKEVKSEIE